MKVMTHRGISLMVLLTVALIGLALNPTPAAAQTSTYMQVSGIAGSSTDAQHVGWINVTSVGQSWKVGSNATACEIEVLKGIDAAGPLLWAQGLRGTSIPDIRIEVMMAKAGVTTKIYEYRLRAVVVTGFNAATTPTFAETVTFRGTSLELIAFPVNATGTAVAPVSRGWNCATNSSY